MPFDSIESSEQFGGAGAGAALPGAAGTAPELTQSDLVPSVPEGTPLFKPKFAAAVNPPDLSGTPLADTAAAAPAVNAPAAALPDVTTAAPEGHE